MTLLEWMGDSRRGRRRMDQIRRRGSRGSDRQGWQISDDFFLRFLLDRRVDGFDGARRGFGRGRGWRGSRWSRSFHQRSRWFGNGWLVGSEMLFDLNKFTILLKVSMSTFYLISTNCDHYYEDIKNLFNRNVYKIKLRLSSNRSFPSCKTGFLISDVLVT